MPRPRQDVPTFDTVVGMQRTILGALRGHPGGRTVEELAEACYSGARWPLTYDASVRATVSVLRAVAAREGHTINRGLPRNKRGGRYVLTLAAS